jgi:hypothetical protein
MVRRVKWDGLSRLLARGWRWEKNTVKGRPRLLLVSPRARSWTFRMTAAGSFLKPHDTTKPTP